MTKLTEVEKRVKMYKEKDEVTKALRNIQSQKSRWKKKKLHPDYEEKMTWILQEEQILKEVREYFEPKQKFVTEFDENDIKNLDYESSQKALRSIQSKKSRAKYQSESEYELAVEIEEMIKSHIDKIEPLDDGLMRKRDLMDLIEHFENQKTLDKQNTINKLKELIK